MSRYFHFKVSIPAIFYSYEFFLSMFNYIKCVSEFHCYTVVNKIKRNVYKIAKLVHTNNENSKKSITLNTYALSSNGVLYYTVKYLQNKKT